MNVHSDGVLHSASLPREDGKRQQILQAALKVFARTGVHGTAVPEIAAAARVGVGTLYRYFENKERLVNELFRDTKQRLQARLFEGLALSTSYKLWFDEIWARLTAFATEEPEAFQFLEMQDHLSYLDDESRRTEMELLAPLRTVVAGAQQSGLATRAMSAETMMALFWGAFVGIFKAQRLGYLKLGAEDIRAARDACWAAFTVKEAG